MKRKFKNLIILKIFLVLLMIALSGLPVFAWVIDVSHTERTLLSAVDARCVGDQIKLENNYSLGYWNKGDFAEWDIKISKDGKYKIIVDYARPLLGEGEGETVTAVVRVGKQSLTQELAPTGGWQIWQTAEIGDVELSASDISILITNKDLIPSAFINLRKVILVPLSEELITITEKTNLTALNAQLQGDDIALENFENDLPNICYWSPGCSAYWNINVETAGTYKIALNYARGSTQSDLPVIAEAGENIVTYELMSTGKWEEYTDVEIGEIHLSTEDSSFVLTHGDNLKTDLMNLRYVTLELVEPDPEVNTDVNAGTEIFVIAFGGMSLVYAGVGAIKNKRKT